MRDISSKERLSNIDGQFVEFSKAIFWENLRDFTRVLYTIGVMTIVGVSLAAGFIERIKSDVQYTQQDTGITQHGIDA